MCSTCDCDQGKQLTDAQSTLSHQSSENELKKNCRKCGSDPYIVLDKVHVECEKCFLESCNKKIRSTLGRSKLIRNNDSILIAHSGGASSSALLDLLKSSMQYESRREQKLRPSILYVDTAVSSDPSFVAQKPTESSGTNLGETRSARLQSFLDPVRASYPDWPLYWTTLEISQVFTGSQSTEGPLYVKYAAQDDLSDSKSVAIMNNVDAYEKFILATEGLDLTDRQEYVRNCTSELINKIAYKLNASFDRQEDRFKYLFVGSSATQLANNLLVDVILGHGATISSTVNVCDIRPSVPVVRAMREFSKKEIAYYLRVRNINYRPQLSPGTFAGHKDSIHKLTEAFLSKLDVDYPSTYSTLLRTGTKMQDAVVGNREGAA